MRKYFKLLLIAGVMLLPLLAFQPAHATDVLNNFCNDPNAARSTACQDYQNQKSSGQNVFIVAVRDVINVLAFITGVAAVIILVISGFKMASSGGEPKTVTEARSGILGAIIGIVVVALAETFVVFVLNRIN